jgi:imidazolonepropionase-like amidohydrolase
MDGSRDAVNPCRCLEVTTMKKQLTVFLWMAAAVGCGSPQRPSGDDRWILTGTRIYAAPDEPPMDNAWVVVNGGKIEAIGPASAEPPTGVRRTSGCSGGVIMAGFQNSHVHFTDAAFTHAATRSRDELERSLNRMLTGFGFTTVVDTGSIVTNTVALRQRIELGDVRGPAILTAGIPLYPQNGIPFYLRDLPPELLRQLPQPATVDEAVAVIRNNFASGANGTKLFVATPQGHGEIRRMSAEIARAAVAETRRLGGLVMVHPTDPEGVSAAVAAGVDIIVHTTIDPPNAAWSDELVREMLTRKVSVVPTLKLWGYELDKQKRPMNVREGAMGDAARQLKAFSDGGGQVLFGTDVGYMTDFDPTDEYVLMARAGLTPMQILASLTTAPAARWSAAERRGRLKPGFDADLVVLDSDPAADVRHFVDVKCTIRAGREVFVRTATK